MDRTFWRGNYLNEWRPDEWREYKDKSMQRFNRIRCDRLPYFFTHILTWWAIIRFHLTLCLSTHYNQKKILLSMSFVKEMILTGDQTVVKTDYEWMNEYSPFFPYFIYLYTLYYDFWFFLSSKRSTSFLLCRYVFWFFLASSKRSTK